MLGCCDESGIHAKARWWTFGALWLPDNSQLPPFAAAVTELRQRTNCWGEFKWEKVNLAYLEPYRDFLALALALPDIRFTSMVVDTELLTPEEMAKYNALGGEKEAYLKFMRLLLSFRVSPLVDLGHEKFTLLYDKLAVPGELRDTFRDVLQNDMRNIAGQKGKDCKYVHLSQVNSATLSLMQATDLLTGATWAAWEDAADRNPEREEARRALQEQIEAWAGGKLTHEDFHRTRYYSLWRWKPKDAKPVRAEIVG